MAATPPPRAARPQAGAAGSHDSGFPQRSDKIPTPSIQQATPMNFPPRIELIETTARLREFCAQLADAPWIAVDTEFLREKTYYPKFCLAQIATQSQVACIDPLAIDDLDPLADVLFHPGTIKIFHAARQDLEVFYHIWKKLPHRSSIPKSPPL